MVSRTIPSLLFCSSFRIAVARREFLAIRRTGVYTRWALLVTLPLLREDERVVAMVMIYGVEKQAWACMFSESFY